MPTPRFIDRDLQPEITYVGKHYTAECEICGALHHAHEYIHGDGVDFRERALALRNSDVPCDQCQRGYVDGSTFKRNPDCYAGRVTFGYESTAWRFDTKWRRLHRELRRTYDADTDDDYKHLRGDEDVTLDGTLNWQPYGYDISDN